MAKKLSNFAVDIIIRNLILPIVAWACEHTKAFCFVIIGVDGQVADVACVNSQDLMCDGAIAVALSPEMAAILEDLHGGVDILREQFSDDPDYKKRFENYPSPRQDDQYWLSFDHTHIRNNGIPQKVVNPHDMRDNERR